MHLQKAVRVQPEVIDRAIIVVDPLICAGKYFVEILVDQIVFIMEIFIECLS